MLGRVTDAPEFTLTCSLRWSDFDLLGHLNQAVYHVLIEQSRTAWLEHVRGGDVWSTDAFVLARVELDYRSEVGASHREVIATCRPVKVGTSSVICEQQVRLLDGTVAASGQTVMVGWDLRARGKRELGEAERASLLT